MIKEVKTLAFCSGCGAELPADAQFCPKCGSPANGPGAQAPPFDGMSRREARHAYRAMRRDARWGDALSPEWALFNTIFGGLFVIILGVCLYLAASGITSLVTWANFWAYMLLGFGALLLLRGFFGIFTARRHLEYGNITGGLVLMTIGAAGITFTLEGASRYLWIGIIIAGGLLVIIAGVLNYMFRRH